MKCKDCNDKKYENFKGQPGRYHGTMLAMEDAGGWKRICVVVVLVDEERDRL